MNGHRTVDAAIDAFLAEGITELPDRTFEAVRSDIHRTRQRVVLGPWREPSMLTPIRIAVAAAIFVIAVGVAWTQLGPKQPGVGGPSSPAPTTGGVATPGWTAPQASTPGSSVPRVTPTLITGDNHALGVGRYAIDYAAVPGATGAGPTISFEIGATGWSSVAAYGVERNYKDAISPGAAVTFWNITNLSVDACTDHAPRPTPPGPSVDDLLAALAGQAGVRPGAITPVTIGGHAGKYVDLTITVNPVECPGGFLTWGSGTDGRDAKGPGEVDRVYALDVDGQRITFFTRQLTDTAATHVRQMEQIVESIAIEP